MKSACYCVAWDGPHHPDCPLSKTTAPRKSSTSLYGLAEIADEIGVRRGTVAQWHRRGKLPAPDALLAMGPVWTEQTLLPWLQARDEGDAMDRQRKAPQ